MRVILYAAGRATRLGRDYAGIPKVLLSFGTRSLLEWHLGHLAALGLHHVTVVTGHQQLQIQAALPALRRRYGLEVSELYNSDFGEGSVISMLKSLPELEAASNGALLMDGDVLYHREVLERLIESPHPTALLMDRNYATVDDDPVLVPMRNGRPFEFRKQWQGAADTVGESVGFFKVAPRDLPLLAEETRRRSTGIARLDSFDEVIRVLVRAGRFASEDITGLPWTEIDFPHDIAYAETQVLPALLAHLPGGTSPV